MSQTISVLFETKKIGYRELKNIYQIGILKIKSINIVYKQNLIISIIFKFYNLLHSNPLTSKPFYFILIRNGAVCLDTYRSLKEINSDEKIVIYGDSVVKNDESIWYESRPIFSPNLFKSDDYVGDVIISNFYLKNFYEFQDNVNRKKIKIVKVDYAISMRFSKKLNRYKIPILEDYSRLKIEQFKKSEYKFSLSVIIPTKFESKDLFGIENCIRSLVDICSNIELEIIVIYKKEDHSKFNLLTAELSYISELIGVSYDEDFNFSKTINKGANIARKEYFLILNDDIIFYEESDILHLLSHFKTSRKLGSIGIRLTNPKGEILHAGQEFRNGSVDHFLKKSKWEYLANAHGVCREISGVTAAVLFMEKNFYFEVGGMNEIFPNDFNDVDLMLRIRARKFENLICSKVIAHHAESLTRGITSSNELDLGLAKLAEIHGKIPNRDPFLYTPAERMSIE